MARRRGLVRVLAQAQRQAQRDLKKKQAASQKEQARLERERAAERDRRNRERALIAEQKERERRYIETRRAHAARKDEQLQQYTRTLNQLLLHTLSIDPFISLESLKQPFTPSVFDPGPLDIPESPPQWQMYMPHAPSIIQRLLPGAKARHARAIAKAQEEYQMHVDAHEAREVDRQQALERMRAEYEQRIAAEQRQIAAQHAEIDAFQRDLQAGLPQATIKYCSMVLAASAYPEAFPQKADLTYIPTSKQLVIEYTLPLFSCIPKTQSYRYVKSQDIITETVRSQAYRKWLYRTVIDQITLRTLSELFRADRLMNLDTIVFNGYVEQTDENTRQAVRTCLMSVQTNRNTFASLDLQEGAPRTCLTMLKASLSKDPSEYLPVSPRSGSGREKLSPQERLAVEGGEGSRKLSLPLPQVPLAESRSEARRGFDQPVVAPNAQTHVQPAPLSAKTRRRIKLNPQEVARLQEEAELLQARLSVESEEEPEQLPSPSTLQPSMQLDPGAISKLQEEAVRLQERLAFEGEERGRALSGALPELATGLVAPVTKGARKPAPGVDEDWQIILQQWQPEHWEILRLLYSKQVAQLVTVERTTRRPVSRLIDEVNFPVEEQLGDLLVDPEAYILAPHLQLMAESLIHWYFSPYE